MITAEEEKFIKFWEENRSVQKKFFYKLLVGLPMGLVFGLPIILSLIFKGWYKNMDFISGSQVTVVLIAVFGITVFYALFRMHMRWEMNEQFYKELKFKQSTTDAA